MSFITKEICHYRIDISRSDFGYGLLPQTKRLVLDLKDMTYMDSYGLGVLVGTYVSAKRQDCQLTLIDVGQQAKNVLRITNLTYLVE